MSTQARTLEGFPATLTRAWIWGRRLLWIALAVFAGMIVLNAIHLHDLLAAVHPWLARGVTGLLAAALFGWCGWAFLRYLSIPRVLVPPDLPDPEEGWSEAQRFAYRDFAVRYLRRQLRNPHLPDEGRARIPEAIAAVDRAAAEATVDEPVARALALRKEVDKALGEVLAPLDERANRLIRRAAVEVATATAVSPSILLDSLITLTRNVNLIAKLADLYYGRPGLLGTARIVRDVIGSAIMAGALEVVSDHVSGALAEMTGNWSSRLIGPLGQGMVNGVLTMRFGAATKYRCRSVARRRVPWRPWDLRQYRRAFSTLMRWISEELGPSVLGPLQRFASWTGKATDSTVRGGQGLLRKVRDQIGGGGEPEEPADDPLLDSGLIG